MKALNRARRVCGTCALLALFGIVSGGCFDYRRAVAFNTLVTPQGRFDQDTLAAALSARFPPGTPVDDLRQYVAGNKGHCNEKEQDRLWCEIPLRGGICWAELVGIEVAVSEGKIESLHTVIGGLDC